VHRLCALIANMAKLSISPEVIRKAKPFSLKVSSFCENKLRDETQRRRDQEWNGKHAAFLADYAKLMEREGVALEDFRTF
jgi:post-segregation antitoxin (ccd killing protein)